MATLQLLLRALGHPRADNVQIDALMTVVAWLEDRKIRAYKVEDRKTLASPDSPGWQAAYDKVRSLHDLRSCWTCRKAAAAGVHDGPSCTGPYRMCSGSRKDGE